MVPFSNIALRNENFQLIELEKHNQRQQKASSSWKYTNVEYLALVFIVSYLILVNCASLQILATSVICFYKTLALLFLAAFTSL